MGATLDGIVEGTEAVFEAKFMLPWSFSEEQAAEKYTAQLQHNMWVTHLRTSVLSVITGGGKWVEITIPIDPLSGFRRKEVLALCANRGASTPRVCRAASPTDCGFPSCGYELVEFLGRVCRAL
jgi:hypothetical protein